MKATTPETERRRRIDMASHRMFRWIKYDSLVTSWCNRNGGCWDVPCSCAERRFKKPDLNGDGPLALVPKKRLSPRAKAPKEGPGGFLGALVTMLETGLGVASKATRERKPKSKRAQRNGVRLTPTGKRLTLIRGGADT